MDPRPPPPLPTGRPDRFRVTVHGTVFGTRASRLAHLRRGDWLMLIPGPPIEPEPGVWVHDTTGNVVGHLPPEVAEWLAPWMLRGGRAAARVLQVHGPEVPSWRRLLIEVTCFT